MGILGLAAYQFETGETVHKRLRFIRVPIYYLLPSVKCVTTFEFSVKSPGQRLGGSTDAALPTVDGVRASFWNGVAKAARLAVHRFPASLKACYSEAPDLAIKQAGYRVDVPE